MRNLAVACLFATVSALAAPPETTDPCPLTEAQMAKAAGQKVLKRELQVGIAQTAQCLFTMESGSVQVMRLSPSLKNVTTDAELAAVLAEKEKRRQLKDFPVPAYTFTGGVNVVLPKGVWQIIAHRGPGAGLDPTKIARALVDAQAK